MKKEVSKKVVKKAIVAASMGLMLVMGTAACGSSDSDDTAVEGSLEASSAEEAVEAASDEAPADFSGEAPADLPDAAPGEGMSGEAPQGDKPDGDKPDGDKKGDKPEGEAPADAASSSSSN